MSGIQSRNGVSHQYAYVSYGENGFPLQDLSPRKARRGSRRGWNDLDSEAFPGHEFGQKISIRLLFIGFPAYTRQVNVLCIRGGKSIAPTKARLAAIISRELRRFLISHPTFPYRLKDLVLLHLEYVSTGTMQPVIAVRHRGLA
ncbi:hypothetical protein C8Q76DRAFT_737967 [Earliella scabrosa]|nr:hypothetical protein C8Q76DRAFT_737967 [Earliella scabrosa]